MTFIGVLLVSWQQVIICLILVSGCVALGIEGKETLAATLGGAAAGYIIQPVLRKELPP